VCDESVRGEDGESRVEHVGEYNESVVVGCVRFVWLCLCVVDGGLVAVVSVGDEEDVVL